MNYASSDSRNLTVTMRRAENQSVTGSIST